MLTNSADPDQMPHSVASDQGLHCLLKPVFQVFWVTMVAEQVYCKTILYIYSGRHKKNVKSIQFAFLLLNTSMINEMVF